MIILHMLVTHDESLPRQTLPRAVILARMDHPHRFHYPSRLISQSARSTTVRISRWIVRSFLSVVTLFVNRFSLLFIEHARQNPEDTKDDT